VLIAVDRASGLIVGQGVLAQLEWQSMQDFVDRLPAAPRYASDGAEVYEEVLWPAGGAHVLSYGKEETHTVESVNANLRTYLKRLARRSRCFSRKLAALQEAVRLFVWHYNRRQRVRNADPRYHDALTLVF
jgi:IS1 family transposase